jgi:hypothetical protein
MAGKSENSSSSVQIAAETEILAWLASEYGYDFSAGAKLPVDIGVQPDAVDLQNQIVVEVYARIGKAAGGQLQKIKGDVLKFALISKRLGAGWKYLYCFASHEAANSVTGSGWVAEAAKEFGVEVLICPISDELKATLLATQKRQKMVNA